jgi:hypothetical protein
MRSSYEYMNYPLVVQVFVRTSVWCIFAEPLQFAKAFQSKVCRRRARPPAFSYTWRHYQHDANFLFFSRFLDFKNSVTD